MTRPAAAAPQISPERLATVLGTKPAAAKRALAKLPGPDRARAVAKAHPELTVAQVGRAAGLTSQAARSALRSSPVRGRPAGYAGSTLADAEERREHLSQAAPGKVHLARIRALRLVAVLLRAGRDGATVADLTGELGCSRATLYRLRDDAIAAGLMIVADVADEGSAGTWRIEVVQP